MPAFGNLSLPRSRSTFFFFFGLLLIFCPIHSKNFFLSPWIPTAAPSPLDQSPNKQGQSAFRKKKYITFQLKPCSLHSNAFQTRVSARHGRNLQNHREKPGLLSRASSLPDEKWECNNRAQNIKYNKKTFRWNGGGERVWSWQFYISPQKCKICERHRQVEIERRAKTRQRWAAECEAPHWRAELRKPF